ncbi:MAG TPA: hypothetical protein PKL29_10075 [Methanothrix sp.]|nr:hypothetical protein [Methanothrix sp.]
MKSIEESFFTSPAFQALTIGVPFCTYKLLFGLLAGRVGLEQSKDLLFVLSWLILAWALVDLLMNMIRVVYFLAGWPSPVEYCIIAQAGRLFHRPSLFLAIDTLVSFSIICFVLWSGWIAFLSQLESYLWNAATTLNLISISFVNIWMELRRNI